MGEITDQNQPVSHRLSLAYASCIRAGQRAAAGKTARAGAGPVTHRASGPMSSRGPLGPGAARRSWHYSPAGRRVLTTLLQGLSATAAVAMLMAVLAVPAGDGHEEAGGTRAGSGVAGMDGRPAISRGEAQRGPGLVIWTTAARGTP